MPSVSQELYLFNKRLRACLILLMSVLKSAIPLSGWNSIILLFLVDILNCSEEHAFLFLVSFDENM
jgi:hypothetical protein